MSRILSTQDLAKKWTVLLVRSVWLFPALLTIALIILVTLQIHGSSIGIYHSIFYGNEPDQDLLSNYAQPQPIRSDEWVVNSQKAIAQQFNGFDKINSNLGNGENVALLADIPTRDWSTIFKPHNLGFLLLPFDNAFSLRWWLLSYLLVISAYFFILTILPGKRLLAVLLSSSFLCSPFFQWWYTYGTMGSVYYALFGMTAFVKLYQSRKLVESAIWSCALAYIAISFALILYPPFQIPVALVALAFIVGYSIDYRSTFVRTHLKQKAILLACALLLAGATVGIFLYQQRDVISTIRETAYPGQRVVQSGGYNLEHILSSNLSYIFQSPDRAAAYARPEIGATNQSESSNFILLSPLLIPPLLLLLYRRYRRHGNLSFISIFLMGSGLLLVAWAFIPHIDIVGKLTLLSLVPLNRLLIGLGLLNILIIVVFIKEYLETPSKQDPRNTAIYALGVFIIYLLIDFHVMRIFPDFIGFKSAVIFAMPFAIIVFLLLRRYYVGALAVLFLLSLGSVYKINPLYQGTEVLTQTPISREIRGLSSTDKGIWVSDYIFIENFSTMNGARSLTGTYTYPQLTLWDDLNLTEQRDIYNRYAHVSFTFDRDPSLMNRPALKQAIADQFNVTIEPCDTFFKRNNVRFIITTKQFSPDEAPCATPVKSVPYPKITFYIYRLAY